MLNFFFVCVLSQSQYAIVVIQSTCFHWHQIPFIDTNPPSEANCWHGGQCLYWCGCVLLQQRVCDLQRDTAGRASPAVIKTLFVYSLLLPRVSTSTAVAALLTWRGCDLSRLTLTRFTPRNFAETSFCSLHNGMMNSFKKSCWAVVTVNTDVLPRVFP